MANPALSGNNPFAPAYGGSVTQSFTAASNHRYIVAFATPTSVVSGPSAPATGDQLILAIASLFSVPFSPNGMPVNGATQTIYLPGYNSIPMNFSGTTIGWV